MNSDSMQHIYEKRLNLSKAQFILIDHEDAMVATVFKVVQPDGRELIFKNMLPYRGLSARGVLFGPFFLQNTSPSNYAVGASRDRFAWGYPHGVPFMRIAEKRKTHDPTLPSNRRYSSPYSSGPERLRRSY